MRTTPNGRGLGWRRSRPDHRDSAFKFQAPLEVARAIPSHKDLRPQDVPIYDQGALGSCTANGTAALLHFVRKKHRQKTPAPPSRLMIYYNTREIEDTIPYDAGAEVRDALKAAAKYGACFEDLWPYDIDKFTQKPPQNCYAVGQKDQAVIYRPVDQAAYAIKSCLASGYPITFGFNCYPEIDSDEVAKTGVLPMPKPNEKDVGGHCVVLMGYDDSGRYFIVRNSWGTEWGDKGYFYMPYEYVLRNDLSSDFWMIQTSG